MVREASVDIRDALRYATEQTSYLCLIYALVGYVILKLRQDDYPAVGEIYLILLKQPLFAKSRWFKDVIDQEFNIIGIEHRRIFDEETAGDQMNFLELAKETLNELDLVD
jgi:hypothetical protein